MCIGRSRNGISYFDPFDMVFFCRRGIARLSCNREFVKNCRTVLISLLKSNNAGDPGVYSSSEPWARYHCAEPNTLLRQVPNRRKSSHSFVCSSHNQGASVSLHRIQKATKKQGHSLFSSIHPIKSSIQAYSMR